jgi:hypothetical protein
VKNWKTTAFGVGGVVMAAWTLIGAPMLDNNPLTNPDFTTFITTAVTAIGLIFAKDSNVTGVGADAVSK